MDLTLPLLPCYKLTRGVTGRGDCRAEALLRSGVSVRTVPVSGGFAPLGKLKLSQREKVCTQRGGARQGVCKLCARGGNEEGGPEEDNKPALFRSPGDWLRAQRMTPKRWALSVLAAIALLVGLQRAALFGLVGLERLLVGLLIGIEDAIFAGLASAARVAGLAGGVVLLVYAAYLFIVAEDTSKKDK